MFRVEVLNKPFSSTPGKSELPLRRRKLQIS